MVTFHKQGWHRDFDPLIRSIAERKIELTIDPHVYLLVYGFDADNKKGVVKGLLEQLKPLLGHRVIGKGHASSFQLSKDILACDDKIGKQSMSHPKETSRKPSSESVGGSPGRSASVHLAGNHDHLVTPEVAG